jgi:hypothetical protein
MGLVITDLSEEHIAFIFMMERSSEIGNTLAVLSRQNDTVTSHGTSFYIQLYAIQFHAAGNN